MLYSYDVFDTIITRTTKTPFGIFALMQEVLERKFPEGFSPFVIHNFYNIRIEAEKVARAYGKLQGKQEITLEEIYECLGEQNQLSAINVSYLLQLELQTELENILPIEENVLRIKQRIEQGEKVIFISDMYMSESQIRMLLKRACPDIANLKIYVSSEFRETKDACELYNIVQKCENVEWNEWIHTGDNMFVDVVVPRRLGINAIHFSRKGICSWQDELFEYNEDCAGVQLVCGATKRALQQQQEATFSYKVGAGFSGPILYMYISWVLQQCETNNIKTLYFIARDGYLLKIIADQIINAKRYGVKTKYIYGSRKAWRLPSVTSEQFDLINFMEWSCPRFISSFDKITEVLGLTIDELQEYIPFKITNKTYFSEYVSKLIYDILAKNQKDIALRIQEKYHTQRENAKSYLKQELKEMKEENCAFVEVLGSGFSQKCLAELISEWNVQKVQTFYYRLDSNLESEKNRNYSFFNNRLVFGSVIEVICAANHGQTTDYICRAGKWEPILGTDEGQLLDNYGFQDYKLGIISYVAEMLRVSDKYNEIASNLKMPVDLFKYLEEKTNSSLYQYIADMPYGIRGVEKNISSFIPELSEKDMRRLFIFHKGEPIYQYYSGYNLDYSINRLTEKKKRKLDKYQRVGEWRIINICRKWWQRLNGVRILEGRQDFIGGRIVLYGAGKRGQRWYQQYLKDKAKDIQVVLWVDTNYEKYKGKKNLVKAPEKILQVQYDQVLIAVANRESVEEIRNRLLSFGVPQFRIMEI